MNSTPSRSHTEADLALTKAEMIREMLGRGIPAQEVWKSLPPAKNNRTYTYQVAARSGLPTNRPILPNSERDRNLLRMFQQGVSIPQIARIIGVVPLIAERRIREHQLPSPHPGVPVGSVPEAPHAS